MKLTLILTIFCSLFMPFCVYAKPINIFIGGYSDVQFGLREQKLQYQTQANNGAKNGDNNSVFVNHHHSRTKNNIHARVSIKADNDLVYGTYAEINADTNISAQLYPNRLQGRFYTYLKSPYGLLQIGATSDAADYLRIDASSLARATGGINGDFIEYVDLASSDIYITPGLPSASGLPGEQNNGYKGDNLSTSKHYNRANANKIIYHSPRINNIMLGVSYTPDQNKHGITTSDDQSYIKFKDVVNAALNYDQQFGTIIVRGSLGGEIGQAKNQVYDNLLGFNIGTAISRAGFTIAGSIAYIPEYGANQNLDSKLHYWTFGGSYEFGPVAASITYFNSNIDEIDNNKKFQNLSIGFDYQFKPGIMPYAEISLFQSKNDLNNNLDNQGNVFILGTQFYF